MKTGKMEKRKKAEKSSRQASEHTEILSTRAAWASAADNFIFIAQKKQRGEIEKKRKTKARRSVTHFKNSKNVGKNCASWREFLTPQQQQQQQQKTEKNLSNQFHMGSS